MKYLLHLFISIAFLLLSVAPADTGPQVIDAQPIYEYWKIKRYLLSKHSPLADYAAYIQEKSDQTGVDWRMVIAISGIESGFCKHIPPSSHNCWGITQRGGGYAKFGDWPSAINGAFRLFNAPPYKNKRYQDFASTYKSGATEAWIYAVGHFIAETNQY